MSRHDINYPEGTRWPKSSMVAVPDTVDIHGDRVCIERDGVWYSGAFDGWIRVDTETGKIDGYYNTAFKRVTPPVPFSDMADEWVETQHGMADVQSAINTAMEG